MSAGIPKQSDCCGDPCSSTSGGGSQVPGPPGPAGAPGLAGVDGVNAFTELTAPFTMPAVGFTDVADVLDSSWIAIGQTLALAGGGDLEVTAKPSALEVTLENLGYPNNSAPATIVPTSSILAPSGQRGQAGAAGPTIGINDVSPTTTRGDIMVDNGANSPNANVVRLGSGTDGQVIIARASQPTGIAWATVLPNAATDNAIVRFNGAIGSPVPGQTSLMEISDDGALQSTPTGGNARGSKAVDLQVERGAAAQVASGANSVIAGGKNNKASAANSGICAGTTNIASAVSAFVGGGDSNEASALNSAVGAGTANAASGQASFIGGGDSNTASGLNSAVCAGQNNIAAAQAVVAGGVSNTASGTASNVSGGAFNTASGPSSSISGGQSAVADKHGQLSHSAGQFASSGDCQVSELQWRIATTDATANVEMFLDGTSLRASIPSGASWGFVVYTIGRTASGVDALWETKGLIKNIGGAVTLTGVVTQAVIADGTGATWGVSGSVVVDADNTNDSLRIRVTGAIATNIRWHAHAKIVEVAWL